MDKITKKQNKPSLEHEHKQRGTYHKDVKYVEDAEFNYHIIQAWWLSSGATAKEVV